MTHTKFVTGFFELTEDVANPHPDRRNKRRTDCAETWPKGMKLEIRQIGDHRAEIVFYDESRLYINDDDERVLQGEKGFVLASRIIPKLRAVPKNVGFLLRQGYGARGKDVLAHLVESGRLSLDVLEKAIEETKDFTDEQWDSINKKHWL